MSGSMMPPQGGQPQIPPQLLAMLAQQQQQRPGVPQMPMGGPQGAAPPGGQMAAPQGQPPQGPPPPMSQVPPMPIPQGAGMPMAQGPGMPMGQGPMQQQNMQAFGRMAQGRPGGQQPRLTPQEMAHLGRYGDAVIAHLTPGEIAVPPEVQTPQIKKDLAHAFQHAGVPPSNFVAGSPTSSVNPNTGAPEYSLWSSILPVLGAIGGAVAAPYTGGLSVPAGMAIGGALGGAAGGLADHGSATQIALQAAGGGAGGYLGGAMGGATAGAAGGATAGAADAAGTTGASMMADPWAGSAMEAGTGAASGAATPAAASNLSAFGSMVKNIPWRGGLAAGTGAALGSALAPQPAQQPYTPAGFNTPMTPLNRNYNALLGNPGRSTTPQFAGYNPYTSVSSGQPYNFFPGGNQ